MEGIMALIDDVKRMCDRLAPLGWRALLRAVTRDGLDIGQATATALRAALVKDLAAIDRTVPGFEDFAPAGRRGVTAGEPALSCSTTRWPARSSPATRVASSWAASR